MDEVHKDVSCRVKKTDQTTNYVPKAFLNISGLIINKCTPSYIIYNIIHKTDDVVHIIYCLSGT